MLGLLDASFTTSATVYKTGTSARIRVTVVDVGQPATTRPFAELPWSIAALGRRLVKQGYSSNTSKLKIPEEQYDQTQFPPRFLHESRIATFFLLCFKFVQPDF